MTKKRKERRPDVPRASDPTAANIRLEGASFDPAAYEESNVHEVYELIASHFSDTRYKPWPLIPAFLDTLPSGSIGADLGCGNGKYLGVRSCFASSEGKPSEKQQGKRRQYDHDLLIIGMDRSANLIDHAAYNLSAAYPESNDQPQGSASKEKVDAHENKRPSARNEVAVGDAIHSNLRTGSVDFAISIATIHHMATWERRRDAVAEMIRIVAPCAAIAASANQKQAQSATEEETDDPYAVFGSGTGRFMIVVWALEQRGESRRKFEDLAESAAQQAENAEQISEDEDKGQPRNAPVGLDLLVPWVLKEQKNAQENGKAPDSADRKVYQRFYHVFREGELEALVVDATRSINRQRRQGGQKDIKVDCEVAGWERGNWYGAWQCTLA